MLYFNYMGPTNNGFGSFGNSAIPSGNGDIILSSTTTDSDPKKKRVLIFSIFILIFVIVLATILVIFGNIKSAEDVSSAYDSYVEFVIFGTDGENAINSETFDIPVDDYALMEQAESQPMDHEEYFSSLYEKLKNFQDNVSNNRTFKDTDLPDILKQQEGFLKFYIFSSQILYSDLIINNYFENTGGLLQNDINEMTAYGDFLPANFLKSLEAYINLRQEYYDTLFSLGCIDWESLDIDCPEDVSGETLENIIVAIDDEYAKLRAQNRNSYANIVGALQNIHKEIAEEKDE